LVIGCDANTHHTQWGCPNNNDRDESLFDFILNSNLFLCNRGNVPTFITKACQTIIEVALHKPTPNTTPTHLPSQTTSHSGPDYGVIRTVPRVSLAGSLDQKLAQSQTVCSGTYQGHIKKTDNTTQNTETGTLKKLMDKMITGSTIHTSTVQKGPHPKLGMMGGRKPAANASATCASAPKAAVGTAKALGPPAGANKYTYAERRTAAQTLRSHTRSTVATPSPEWLKKVEWARKVLPNYGQDKPRRDAGEKAAIPRTTRAIGEEI